MIANRDDVANEAAGAQPAEAFDDSPRLTFEQEIEQRLEKRLRTATGFYQKFLFASILVLLMAVAYWILAPRKTPEPAKVSVVPAEVSEQLKAFTQQYEQFQAANQQIQAANKQFEALNRQSQAAYSEITNRVARLREIDAQLAAVNVTTNLQRLDMQLQSLESVRSKTGKLFDSVSELNDYYLALSALRPDENNRIDRTALDPLRRIAQNPDHSLALSARAAIRTVANSLESERQTYLNTGAMMPFNTNTITFDQTLNILKRQTDPFRVIKLITFMGTNPNFPKAEQMNFLMDTYDHSTNLLEVYVAELAIKSQARLAELQPFAFDQIHDWWKQNQSGYR